MGDLSDMILDGILCEGCGSYIDDEELGFPRKCDDCVRFDERLNKKPPLKQKSLTDDEAELLVNYLKTVAVKGLKKDR